jgi:hypothetical protein
LDYGLAGGQEGDIWGEYGLYIEGDTLEPTPMTADNTTFPGAPLVDIMEPCNYSRYTFYPIFVLFALFPFFLK